MLYRSEPDHCRPFPGPASADLRRGAKRNFQVFSALDFLAEVTQHIPEKGEHLVRYYGWYSHRRRGMRSVWHQLCAAPEGRFPQLVPDTLGSSVYVSGTALAAGDFMTSTPTRSVSEDFSTLARSASEGVSTTAVPRSSSVWAMLIQRIYEVDPLKCPRCGGTMKIISFIERGQSDVIERILKHCGLWEGPIRTLAGPRPPPGTGPPTGDVDEYELVLDGDFIDAQAWENEPSSLQPQASSLTAGDYQLVLDPEFL